MSAVVFAEGRNDVEFLTVLHELYHGNRSYDVFRNENEQMAETARITRHIAGDSYQYLYKSEGGDSQLIEIFVEVSMLATDGTFDPYVLIDLDGATVADRLAEFNRTYTEAFRNDAELVCEGKTRWSDIVHLDCQLACDNRDDVDVDVFAFYEKLETHSGVRYGDDKSDRLDTLESYVENDPDTFDELANVLY